MNDEAKSERIELIESMIQQEQIKRLKQDLSCWRTLAFALGIFAGLWFLVAMKTATDLIP